MLQHNLNRKPLKKFKKKEYTEEQIKVIEKTNKALKSCFLPKDDTLFIKREIQAYMDLILEIDKLPITIMKDNGGINFEMILIKDFRSFDTLHKTKRIIILDNILSTRNQYSQFPKSIDKDYIKLISVKRLISKKMHALHPEAINRIGYFYWGEKSIVSELSMGKPKNFNITNSIKRYKTNSRTSGNNQTTKSKKSKRVKSSKKMVGDKWSIKIPRSFMLHLEELVLNNKREIHVAKIIKTFQVSQRTFYKWNESYQFGIEHGNVNIMGLIEFIKYQDLKFSIIEDIV